MAKDKDGIAEEKVDIDEVLKAANAGEIVSVPEEEEVEEQATPDPVDPQREVEESLGFDPLDMSAKEAAVNENYLASMAVLGNRMMLDILVKRSEKANSGKSDDFAQVTAAMQAVTGHYNDTISKDNFSSQYGTMLLQYTTLHKACAAYLDSSDPSKSRIKKREKTRVAIGEKRKYATQAIGVVEQEVNTIRARGGKLAQREIPVSWKNFFVGEAISAYNEEMTLRNTIEGTNPAADKSKYGAMLISDPNRKGEAGEKDAKDIAKEISAGSNSGVFLSGGRLNLTGAKLASVLASAGETDTVPEELRDNITKMLDRYNRLNSSDNDAFLKPLGDRLIDLCAFVPESKVLVQLIKDCNKATELRRNRMKAAEEGTEEGTEEGAATKVQGEGAQTKKPHFRGDFLKGERLNLTEIELKDALEASGEWELLDENVKEKVIAALKLYNRLLPFDNEKHLQPLGEKLVGFCAMAPGSTVLAQLAKDYRYGEYLRRDRANRGGLSAKEELQRDMESWKKTGAISDNEVQSIYWFIREIRSAVNYNEDPEEIMQYAQHMLSLEKKFTQAPPAFQELMQRTRILIGQLERKINSASSAADNKEEYVKPVDDGQAESDTTTPESKAPAQAEKRSTTVQIMGKNNAKRGGMSADDELDRDLKNWKKEGGISADGISSIDNLIRELSYADEEAPEKMLPYAQSLLALENKYSKAPPAFQDLMQRTRVVITNLQRKIAIEASAAASAASAAASTASTAPSTASTTTASSTASVIEPIVAVAPKKVSAPASQVPAQAAKGVASTKPVAKASTKAAGFRITKEQERELENWKNTGGISGEELEEILSVAEVIRFTVADKENPESILPYAQDFLEFDKVYPQAPPAFKALMEQVGKMVEVLKQRVGKV